MLSKLREDFHCLKRERSGKPPIYLDNACMTLKPEQVVVGINRYYNSFPACGGGRSNHWFSKEVNETIARAREKVASFINAQPEEIVWMKNATEGINLVATGYPLEDGDTVITSDREHNSNLVPWIKLSKHRGIEHRISPSTREETFDLEAFEEMLGSRVKLVSVVHTSNLDGYTLPVREIIKLSHDYGARVLLDSAQAVPHSRVDVKKLNADFLAFSVHKMLGPSLGVLYGKQEELEALNPFITGGGSVSHTSYSKAEFLPPPHRFEAGLQDYAAQIGAGEAVDYLSSLAMKRVERHGRKLTELLLEKLSSIPEAKVVGVCDTHVARGMVSFRLERDGKLLVAPGDIAEMLDKRYNIMLRAGNLCMHPWLSSRRMGASGVSRASFYIYNTSEEVKLLARGIERIVEGEKHG